MKKTEIPWGLVKCTSIIVLALWLIIPLIILLIFNNNRPDAGQFGDIFGAVNALFSGAALLGVILAIYLQSKELEAQRTELELTRNEIEEQKEEIKKQGKTFEVQRFEDNLFNLLRTFNGIIDSIVLRKTNTSELVITAESRDCFKVFVSRLTNCFNETGGEQNPNALNAIEKAYLKFYNTNESKIGHYFRNLYNIIKYIDSSNVDDKRLYVNIVKSQLCIDELIMLFYNCLSPFGISKFKPFVEKYALLESLNDVYLIKPTHMSLYNEKAFKTE